MSTQGENDKVINMDTNNIDMNKRKFVRKAAYVAPAIVTMAAMPSFASAGSNFSGNDRLGYGNGNGNGNGNGHRNGHGGGFNRPTRFETIRTHRGRR